MANFFGVKKFMFIDIELDYAKTGSLLGIEFLYQKLKENELSENYEECIKIKEAISQLSKSHLLPPDFPSTNRAD